MTDNLNKEQKNPEGGSKKRTKKLVDNLNKNAEPNTNNINKDVNNDPNRLCPGMAIFSEILNELSTNPLWKQLLQNDIEILKKMDDLFDETVKQIIKANESKLLNEKNAIKLHKMLEKKLKVDLQNIDY